MLARSLPFLFTAHGMALLNARNAVPQSPTNLRLSDLCALAVAARIRVTLEVEASCFVTNGRVRIRTRYWPLFTLGYIVHRLGVLVGVIFESLEDNLVLTREQR